MTAPLSSYGITKEQHDAIAATRNRPITDDPMHIKPADMRAAAPDGGDVIDDAMGQLGAAALARFTTRRRARQQGAHL